jgi:hypothetical protein
MISERSARSIHERERHLSLAPRMHLECNKQEGTVMRAGMSSSVAALVFVAAGCGATIRSTTASNADLAKYRTYSFFTSPAKAGQAETIVDQTINSSLKEGLAAKGLTEVAPGQAPDFLVAHHVKTQQKLDVEPGYGFYGFGGTDVTQYTEGTLIVDFIDPQTKQVFWRGTATDVVSHPESPNTGKLSKVVGQIVDRYPSAIAAAPRTTM